SPSAVPTAVPLTFSMPTASPIAPPLSDSNRSLAVGPPVVSPLSTTFPGDGSELDSKVSAYTPTYTAPVYTAPVEPKAAYTDPVYATLTGRTNADPTSAAPPSVDPTSFDSTFNTAVPVFFASSILTPSDPIAIARTPANDPAAISTNLVSAPQQVFVSGPAMADTTIKDSQLLPAQAFRVTNNITANEAPTTPAVARQTINGGPMPVPADVAQFAEAIAKMPDFATAHNLASDTTNSAPDTKASPSNNPTNGTTNNVTNSIPSLTSDLTASKRTPSPDAAGPNPTNTIDERSKSLASPQPSTAAAPQPTSPDKKPATLGVNATSIPVASFSSPAVSTTASQSVIPVLPAGIDPSPAITAPNLPVAPMPVQVNSNPAQPLPQTHQMLDSAPSAAPVSDPTALPGDVHSDPQTPAQMHVGLRTDAFGAVEIHTVVQQSQIGISVHSDRDISRWFSSEVPGLESGLNNSHLNLTGVNFDHGRSGVQAETGFQQGEPRQQQPQTFGAPASPSSGSNLAEPEPTEFATVNVPSVDSSTGPAQVRVSILA
ncbi:MAG: hypothetical protein ABSG43_31255, partial [Solirubrobacteraceae bacterium]